MEETKSVAPRVLTIFQFQGHDLQVIEHQGEPWFIGKQVCDALSIANSRDAISRLSPHQRDDVGISDAIGRIQRTTIISEGGLYKLAFRSHKKEAEEFTDRVVDEILPAIRRTGKYSPKKQPRVCTPERYFLPPAEKDQYILRVVEYFGVANGRDVGRLCKWYPIKEARRRMRELAQAGVLIEWWTGRTWRYKLPPKQKQLA